MACLNIFESSFTFKTSKCFSFEAVQTQRNSDASQSRTPFLKKAEGGIVLPSVSIVKLTPENMRCLDTDHWIKDLMKHIHFECGINAHDLANSIDGHVFLKLMHTSLEIDESSDINISSESVVESANLISTPLTNDSINQVPIDALIIAAPLRRRTPATLSIAFELPNHFFKDTVNNECTAVIVVLNILFQKVCSTGGDYFQFDAQTLEVFGDDTITESFSVSEQLNRYIKESFPLYIDIVPPNQSWTFLNSDDLQLEGQSSLTNEELERLKFMELQRFSLQIVGSLYLASPSYSYESATTGVCASMHEDEISIVRAATTEDSSGVSPSPVSKFVLGTTVATALDESSSVAHDILTICVAVAVEMNDSNDAMNVIGIPMINKSSAAIVTTSNRNELEDARKYARQLVEEVGYKGRDDILALCSKYTNEPQILSVAQYHESTIESVSNLIV
jgi:hypothetical protein